MELALYCPVCGYYEKEADTVGRRGDFYTNVSVGSLFGELLAVQFAAWLAPLQQAAVDAGGPASFTIVEAGAHDGRLAADVLAWLRERRPALFADLRYCILEPSAARRQWQQRRLEAFAPRVHWSQGIEQLETELGAAISHRDPERPAPRSGICGILFSNELLDALPVHRLVWDAAAALWLEWGVTLENGRLAWGKMGLRPGGKPNTDGPFCGVEGPETPRLPERLLEVLPDGFTIEVSPAAEQWWRQAAASLRQGKLVTVDYGLASEEMFTPERSRGTLRAYHRHQVSDDLLARPGEQDLTAHVNFTAIQKAGEASGLRTERLEPQGSFLTRIAQEVWRAPADFGGWSPARTRQFQTLVHPDHLGRSFRVLVQER